MGIPFNQLLIGSLISLENAESFISTSTRLYNEKKYQVSIPLVTFAIEETLKGYYLLRFSRKSETLELNDWNKLKNHKYKLTQLFKEVMDSVQNIEEREFESHREKFAPQNNNVTLDQVKKALPKNIDNFSNYQKLREAHVYSDWNDSTQSWYSFHSDESYDALNYYVLQDTTVLLINFKIAFENEINKLRKKGLLTETISFIKYPEYREMNKYDSVSLAKQQHAKLNSQMYKKGEKLFSKFISGVPINLITYEIFTASFGDYFRMLNAKSDWQNAHPLVKALMIYFSKREEEKEVYSAISMGAAKSSDHVASPFMVTSDKDNKDKIIIIDLQEKKKLEYNENFIEKVLKTELILDRKDGDSVPLNVFIESMSTIGLKSKVIKHSEMAKMIKKAKEELNNHLFDKLDKNVTNEIKSLLDVEGWYSCSYVTRNIMITTYGNAVYPGYQLYILETDNILKEKCRWTILQNLYHSFFRTV